ncbi:hypothetical protein ABTN14_19280, partial [Acinetobacter baumannii]
MTASAIAAFSRELDMRLPGAAISGVPFAENAALQNQAGLLPSLENHTDISPSGSWPASTVAVNGLKLLSSSS